MATVRGTDKHLRSNRDHTSVNTRADRGLGSGLGSVLNDLQHYDFAKGPVQRKVARLASQPSTSSCLGEQQPAVGCYDMLEPKRKRLSVNKGTREARLSRVVTQPRRSEDRPKHLPMRQPSGGAPVVVGDVNDVHMAKGCRMNRCWTTAMFSNLEGSK